MATTFDLMWKHHPARQNPPVIEPCAGKTHFDNQCAIRLGVAMAKAGLDLASYRGTFCWNGHKREHPLRVEEMKLWLDSKDARFVPVSHKSVRPRKGNQGSFHAYLGKRGIVAFLDFWGTHDSGDHIDLWDGGQIAHGERDYFERSREIWFWKMD